MPMVEKAPTELQKQAMIHAVDAMAQWARGQQIFTRGLKIETKYGWENSKHMLFGAEDNNPINELKKRSSRMVNAVIDPNNPSVVIGQCLCSIRTEQKDATLWMSFLTEGAVSTGIHPTLDNSKVVLDVRAKQFDMVWSMTNGARIVYRSIQGRAAELNISPQGIPLGLWPDGMPEELKQFSVKFSVDSANKLLYSIVYDFALWQAASADQFEMAAMNALRASVG